MHRCARLRLTLPAFAILLMRCNAPKPDAPKLVSASPDAAVASDASVGCRSDADCTSGFCDLDTCVSLVGVGSRDAAYGRQCSPGLIGPLGTTFTFYYDCSPGYLCLDGRCRSCSSAAQCYDVMGLLGCSSSDARKGKQCRDAVPAGEETFSPMPPPMKVGHPVDPVPQASGIAGSARLLRADAIVVPPTARLAVVWWHQRAGEFDEFLQIAYDAPYDGRNETDVSLPNIALPNKEDLICFRACRDRSICDCARSPQIALGSILIATDADQDGRLAADEVRTEQLGAANVFIGWAPSDQTDLPKGFTSFERMSQGFAVYAWNDANRLSPVADDVTEPLTLCPPATPSCLLPVDRLFCLRDCERDWGLNRFGL